MPHIDKRTGDIVIRIVYDGAPEAGKTTNVQRLGELVSLQRRGAAVSPGTTGARTEFFDWLDFSGGFIDGRRVRCQLVSVPGQPEVLHRRRYLLAAADAIVYVADARLPAPVATAENLAATRKLLARLQDDVRVPIVLQANKQDLAGALAPAALAAALELDDADALVGAAAEHGDGVLQTFVLAVRLGTDRVRRLLSAQDGGEMAVVEETPGSIYEALLALDAELEAKRVAERASEPAPAPPGAEADPSDDEIVIEFDVVALEPAPARSAEPRRNFLGSPSEVTLPIADLLQSGHVWPPVRGRAAIAAATSGELSAPPSLAAWAPDGAIELQSGTGWVIHTSDAWTYDSEDAARVELLNRVRRLVSSVELQPEGRALALAAEGTGWRLWMMTLRMATLRESLVDCLARHDLAALGALLSAAAGAFPASAGPMPRGADGVALHGGRAIQLALEDPADTVADRHVPLRDLADELERAAARSDELATWLATQGRAWLGEAWTPRREATQTHPSSQSLETEGEPR